MLYLIKTVRLVNSQVKVHDAPQSEWGKGTHNITRQFNILCLGVKNKPQKIHNSRLFIIFMVLVAPSLKSKYYNERAGSACILPIKQKH